MKKRILILSASLLVCAGSVVLWANASNDDLLDANVEGIMIQPRSENGNAYPCHRSSRVASENNFYVDCNKCTKVYGRKGAGKEDECGYDIFN